MGQIDCLLNFKSGAKVVVFCFDSTEKYSKTPA